MAAATAGPRRRGRGRAPMSEINVTPLVDVMLVLLVVFMVTAPLLTAGVPVELPRTPASTMVGQDEPLVVTVNREGEVFLQETRVEPDSLAPRLQAIAGVRPDTRIFVRADRALAYGRVMGVIGRLNAAGFRRVALITDFAGTAGGAR